MKAPTLYASTSNSSGWVLPMDGTGAGSRSSCVAFTSGSCTCILAQSWVENNTNYNFKSPCTFLHTCHTLNTSCGLWLTGRCRSEAETWWLTCMPNIYKKWWCKTVKFLFRGSKHVSRRFHPRMSRAHFLWPRRRTSSSRISHAECRREQLFGACKSQEYWFIWRVQREGEMAIALLWTTWLQL